VGVGSLPFKITLSRPSGCGHRLPCRGMLVVFEPVWMAPELLTDRKQNYNPPSGPIAHVSVQKHSGYEYLGGPHSGFPFYVFHYVLLCCI
jgi:hypothetical protein